MSILTSFDYDGAIRDFEAKLEECTTIAACGRPYILVSKLTKWMESRVRVGNSDTRQANRLLYSVYQQPRWIRPSPPLGVEYILKEPQCVLVFSILLKLRLGHALHVFWRHQKFDNQLPISSGNLLKLFRDNSLRLEAPDTCAKDFDLIQWQFCSPRFDLDMGREYDDARRILPIHSRQEINFTKGGTAKLWQIAVLEDFVGSDLRSVVKNSKYDPKENPAAEQDGLGPRYQFALKVFDEGNNFIYENEKAAFVTLRSLKGVVRYLGEYTHEELRSKATSEAAAQSESGRRKVTKTYNILLEFGECDLDELFIERNPPVLPSEIEAFWKKLFDVATVLDEIHNLKTDADGVVREYWGFHADIKPDNILIIEEEGSSGTQVEIFKLADPGFAKFVKKSTEDGKVLLTGGTETYGAPERHRPSRNTLSTQKVDTWSLGCVFSMAATWVVLGQEGIKQYHQLRKKAIGKIILKQNQDKLPKTITPGDYFHDGNEVLKDVSNWHIFLRNAMRRTDAITSQVLDLVDDKMLLGEVATRVSAKELCGLLKSVPGNHSRETETKMPDSIVTLLFEVDQEAPSKMKSLTIDTDPGKDNALNIVQDRKFRKSKFLGAPLMKTANRSEYLRSELAHRSIVPDLSGSDLAHHPANSAPGTANSPVTRDTVYYVDTSAMNLISNGVVATTPPGSSSPVARRRKSRPTPAILNVFQAREELANHQSKWSLRTRKDEKLSRHFEDRDIKFLVDNAMTMGPSWWEAKFLLETLLMKAKGQDKNGMDLNFTIGSYSVQNSNDKAAFLKSMDKAKPKDGMGTDMRLRLGMILDDYLLSAKKAKKVNMKPRNLTLVILTHGIWQSTPDKAAVGRDIIKIVRSLMDLVNEFGNRPLSIEFVQFGEDPDATYWLRSLDNDLKAFGIPDVIDTENSRGDVNKMLLGSFVPEYDDLDGDDDDSSTTVSPTPTRQSASFGPSSQSPPSMYPSVMSGPSTRQSRGFSGLTGNIVPDTDYFSK